MTTHCPSPAMVLSFLHSAATARNLSIESEFERLVDCPSSWTCWQARTRRTCGSVPPVQSCSSGTTSPAWKSSGIST
uniref:Putative secreted protein n=1 Tax=Ixodes ricinus TaxID=34613 RepID=A0A6B0TW17_IXORI